MADITPDIIVTALGNIAHQAITMTRDMLRFGRFPWYWKMKSALSGLEPPYMVIEREAPGLDVPADELIYGEAPFSVLEHIMKKAGLTPGDRFFDMGCGRGVPVVFSCLRFGCTATGIEIVPGLYEQAKILAGKMGTGGVELIRGDIREEPLDKGTVFYIPGTTFHVDTINALSEKILKIENPVRTICISYPLPGLKITCREKLPFSWGKATVYYQDNIA